MALSAEMKEAIVKDSDNIISCDKERGIFRFEDTQKLQSLHNKQESLQHTLSHFEQKLLSLPITHAPWYKWQDNFNTLAKAAYDLRNLYPDSKIFTLGQSAAWIVNAINYINELKQSSQKVGYIPFSGKFYVSIDDKKKDLELTAFGNRPSKAQEEHYCNLLDKLGLHPREILENYKSEKSTKTTILEFINTGGGIASFLSVLFSWTKRENISSEEMKSALNIILLVEDQEDIKNSIKFDDLVISCKSYIVDGIWSLANGVDKGIYSDRLIPYYPSNVWDNDPEEIVENKDFIKLLTNKINAATERYIESLPSQPLHDQEVSSTGYISQNNNDVSTLGELDEASTEIV